MLGETTQQPHRGSHAIWGVQCSLQGSVDLVARNRISMERRIFSWRSFIYLTKIFSEIHSENRVIFAATSRVQPYRSLIYLWYINFIPTWPVNFSPKYQIIFLNWFLIGYLHQLFCKLNKGNLKNLEKKKNTKIWINLFITATLEPLSGYHIFIWKQCTTFP